MSVEIYAKGSKERNSPTQNHLRDRNREDISADRRRCRRR